MTNIDDEILLNAVTGCIIMKKGFWHDNGKVSDKDKIT